jgi:hypothetical protein
MLKSPLFFVLSLILVVANNLLFSMHEQSFVCGLQTILGVLLCFHFTWSMLNITAGHFPKKYEIPLFIAFIIVARSTESIIRKSLILYSPEFYQEYKLYIFALAILLFLAVVYCLQRVIGQKRIKAD